MTKGELLKFLEPFTDDTEILVNTGLDHANLTKLEPIDSAMYYFRNDSEFGEAWLNLQRLTRDR